ncbi:hypothetical protein QA584_17390 [Anaerocolumna sp. AGMB13025]|uniref:hypothetical protein n=1 Tax=Anaerocolumna sp. AGMB13025 TaxID=3039116 RepID=UPI00241C1585|nr:hypothetical protein [Anaerocolumna sp. AGMB13025]WFR55375.1 hypothetical protein QA584_17390 [Anaerocolumna sp. AGMB13025]
MEIRIIIDEDKIVNFSGKAKEKLKENLEKFAMEVINESERVEQLYGEDDIKPEITASMLEQAVRQTKRSPRRRKKKYITIIKVISHTTTFITGLMFDKNSLTNNGFYFMFFSVIFFTAGITSLMVILKDGE